MYFLIYYRYYLYTILMYVILIAQVPKDNPAAMEIILQDLVQDKWTQTNEQKEE